MRKLSILLLPLLFFLAGCGLLLEPEEEVANQAPVAVLGYGVAPAPAVGTEAVENPVWFGDVKLYLSSNDSHDPDGEIVATTFELNDEPVQNNPVVVRSRGEHVLALTVTDDQGAQSRDSQVFYLEDEPVGPEPPSDPPGGDLTACEAILETMEGGASCDENVWMAFARGVDGDGVTVVLQPFVQAELVAFNDPEATRFATNPEPEEPIQFRYTLSAPVDEISGTARIKPVGEPSKTLQLTTGLSGGTELTDTGYLRAGMGVDTIITGILALVSPFIIGFFRWSGLKGKPAFVFAVFMSVVIALVARVAAAFMGGPPLTFDEQFWWGSTGVFLVGQTVFHKLEDKLPRALGKG